MSFVEKWAEVESSILREGGKYVFSLYVHVRANSKTLEGHKTKRTLVKPRER